MPYSMAILAHTENIDSVKYSDGILCYTQQELLRIPETDDVEEEYRVRILDVHGASETEDVIDMVKLRAELEGYEPDLRHDRGTIFNYQNGILTMKIHTETLNGGSPTLVVIDVRRNFVSTPQSPSRIRKILRDQNPVPRHFMTNGRYLFTVHIIRNVPEWTLKCYDLSEHDPEPSIIALHEFLPRLEDCRFKILGEWLYVCADDGRAFNSAQDHEKKFYYNCCRFPIDNLGPAEEPADFLGPVQHTRLPAKLQAVRLLRGVGEAASKRVCLALVQDERTNDVFILESADPTKLPETDRPYRPVSFPNPKESPEIFWETKISDIVVDIPPSPADYVQETSYPFKAQDVRIHVQPSQSIMDVTQEALGGEEVLHLYASSPERGVWRFPPNSAPQVLRNFLTVSPAWISQINDERSIIVLKWDKEEDSWERWGCTIILLNFDSGIKFPGFQHLPLAEISDKLSSDGGIEQKPSRLKSLAMNKLQKELLELKEEGKSTEPIPEPKALDGDPSWFYTEPAKHLEEEGVQFHPRQPTAE